MGLRRHVACHRAQHTVDQGRQAAASHDDPAGATLVLSRVAFIARNAPNPQGARLWLDHLLSPQGQRLLADGGGLFSVRTDSARPRSALAVGQQLGAAARPIALGPALLAHLDRSKHAALLKRWSKEFEHFR